ncbi:polysaccharide biosynthesis/export family protein [Aquimarina agarilytica]|uniref:polysaccharide biosynthesis/export family protein n=1 Tax=Aquimarina agarilytica TaxID=1087449 RepID=UPI000289899F|nr:polysaccharide biosynthesis/export family protein [Aquimarina agarilytica]
MRYSNLLYCISIILLFFSCKTPEDVAYFQNVKNKDEVSLINSFEPVFKIDDIISVSVSATDMDTARPFNLSQGISSSGETGTSSDSGSSQSPTYLIDYEGNIEFPVLGKLRVVNLTRIQVKKMIKEKLKSYINDPIVSVRLNNFKITVLGEVNNPGSFSIPNERITIIEALGLAGDLTIKGKRTNVTVIRENGIKKTFHKIDLTSKELFNSEAYYLTQNDVLYIEPNESKIRESENNATKLGIVFSSIGVLISVLTFMITVRR